MPNLNELAVILTSLEGKKKQTNIAQIKEVIKCLGIYLSKLELPEQLHVLELLVKSKNYRKKTKTAR